MNSTLADPGVSNDDITGASFRKRRSTVKTTPEMTKARNERLIRAIKAKAKSQELETKRLAEMFGMEYSQLNACYAGVRDFAYLTPHQRQRIANFLGVPPIQVHLWCGLVQPMDFVVETDYKQKIDHIYTNHMLTDPMLCQIVVDEEEWKTLSYTTKLSFVLFYMSYTGSWLLNAAQAAMNPSVPKTGVKNKNKDVVKDQTAGTEPRTAATVNPATAQTPEEALAQAHKNSPPAQPEAPTISASNAKKAQSLVDSVLKATAKEMGTKVEGVEPDAPAAAPDAPLITRRPHRIKITDSKTAATKATAGTATTRTLKSADKTVTPTAQLSDDELVAMWPMTKNMKPGDRRRFVEIAEQALREQQQEKTA